MCNFHGVDYVYNRNTQQPNKQANSKECYRFPAAKRWCRLQSAASLKLVTGSWIGWALTRWIIPLDSENSKTAPKKLDADRLDTYSPWISMDFIIWGMGQNSTKWDDHPIGDASETQWLGSQDDNEKKVTGGRNGCAQSNKMGMSTSRKMRMFGSKNCDCE